MTEVVIVKKFVQDGLDCSNSNDVGFMNVVMLVFMAF